MMRKSFSPVWFLSFMGVVLGTGIQPVQAYDQYSNNPAGQYNTPSTYYQNQSNPYNNYAPNNYAPAYTNQGSQQPAAPYTGVTPGGMQQGQFYGNTPAPAQGMQQGQFNANVPAMQPVQSPGYQPVPVYQQGYAPGAPQGYANNAIISVHSVPQPTMVTLGGTVVPYKEVTLSAQIPGRIEFIAGKEGDFIEKGKVLVTIDDDDLLAQRRQALAELGNAESAMRNSQMQYSRELWSPQSNNINRAPGMGMPSLFDQFFTRNMGSVAGYGNPALDRTADLYSRGTQVTQAQSAILQVRSKLDEIDAKLRDTRSVSPFSGLIVKKFIEVGDTVQPGQPLLNFADTKAMQLKVDVPARLMPGITMGMVVTARLDVGNKQVSARVAQIYPMADVERHTVTVKFDLPEGVPGGPGMYADVMVPDINAPARNSFVIPSTAVRWRGSLPAVYKINQDNKAEHRFVRLGEPVNDQFITVLSGLNDGDRILANPPPRITSGWSPGSNTGGEYQPVQ
jgi:multidrug efflux pump subunit AcrA (membrane-fusion protein)